jgi:NRPS condensation-like uncharacterized protein
VATGSQKCCKECSKKQTASKKKAPGAQYIKDNYDYIRINLPKGEGEEIKAYAQARGMSVKQLMLTALEEYREKHGG